MLKRKMLLESWCLDVDVCLTSIGKAINPGSAVDMEGAITALVAKTGGPDLPAPSVMLSRLLNKDLADQLEKDCYPTRKMDCSF